MKTTTLPSWLSLLAALCLAWLASGCAPTVGIEQPVVQEKILISQGSTAGQTFTARYSGLSAISLWVQTEEPGSGNLRLRLYPEPGAEEVLAESSLPLSQVAIPGYYRFAFPSISGSNQQDYYAQIILEGSGQANLGAGPGGTYLQGARYEQGEAQDGQLAFRLVYDRRAWLLGLVRESLGWMLLLVAGLFLLALPGWALLQLGAPFWPAWQESAPISRLLLSASAGIVVYPIILLAASLLGLRLGSLLAWLTPLAGLVFLIWQGRRISISSLRLALENTRQEWTRRPPWAGMAFLAVTTAIVLTRFWVARGLPAPLWGDSFQHSLITQLILDHGGLFSSWVPYADLDTFTYHFSFHSLSAALAWLAQLPASQSVLWMGQLLNILAVLALFPLATRAGRSPWAGVAAILVAGLLSPLPSGYINWGRYTQVTGQAILPLALFLSWDTLQASPPFLSRFSRLRLPLLTGLVFSGLALAHYRVLVMGILFFAAALAFRLLFAQTAASRRWAIGSSLLAGFTAAVVFLPWFLRSFAGNLPSIFGAQVSTPAAPASALAAGPPFFADLTPFLPAGVWLLAALALAWGLWRREHWAALLGSWSFLMLLVANPNWLNLPGAGAVDNFAVFIAAYLPAGLLLGSATGWLVESLRPDCPPLRPVDSLRTKIARQLSGILLLLAVLGLSAWGVRQRVADIDPTGHALITYPDTRAAAWIRAETPPEASFLINSFFAYGGMAAVGADAGWWLPLTAGRQVNIPPLNYNLEGEPWIGYRAWVNQLPAALETLSLDDPAVLDLLKEREITHVYIGQQQGGVNAPRQPRLTPQALLDSPHFRPVYHQDRVWIFEVED